MFSVLINIVGFPSFGVFLEFFLGRFLTKIAMWYVRGCFNMNSICKWQLPFQLLIWWGIYFLDLALRIVILRKEWYYDRIEGWMYLNMFDALLVMVNMFELVALPAFRRQHFKSEAASPPKHCNWPTFFSSGCFWETSSKMPLPFVWLSSFASSEPCGFLRQPPGVFLMGERVTSFLLAWGEIDIIWFYIMLVLSWCNVVTPAYASQFLWSEKQLANEHVRWHRTITGGDHWQMLIGYRKWSMLTQRGLSVSAAADFGGNLRGEHWRFVLVYGSSDGSADRLLFGHLSSSPALHCWWKGRLGWQIGDATVLRQFSQDAIYHVWDYFFRQGFLFTQCVRFCFSHCMVKESKGSSTWSLPHCYFQAVVDPPWGSWPARVRPVTSKVSGWYAIPFLFYIALVAWFMGDPVVLGTLHDENWPSTSREVLSWQKPTCCSHENMTTGESGAPQAPGPITAQPLLLLLLITSFTLLLPPWLILTTLILFNYCTTFSSLPAFCFHLFYFFYFFYF